jgi:hypothetical protein
MVDNWFCDQIRQCRTAGEEQRFTVLDKFIRSDAEISGQSLVGRTGLDELIRLAKTSPRSFDGIIIDDTSRLGRYAPDVLRVVDILGVCLLRCPAVGLSESRLPSGSHDLCHGYSYTRIAKTLNREGIQSPMPPRKGKVRGGCPSAIRELLLNEKYRGFLVWNRTKTIRNRETGRSEQRPRPQSEWIRIEVPEMRIVSEELWNAAREQNRRAREKHGPRVLGGMNRTEASRCYLFSGLMECGLCGRNITITSGKAPYSRYGCPNHRSRGLCDNEVTILQTKLEEQLISALVKNLLRPELQDELLSLFQESRLQLLRTRRDSLKQR